jgi:site-specific recombinase XerD
MHVEVLPATADTVSLYVTTLLTRKLKVSSVKRHVAAIAYWHRDAGVASPITQDIRNLLRGARRLRCEPVRQMRPLTVENLRAISEELKKDANPLSLRNRAMLVAGFASGLRSANLVALTMEDLEVTDRGCVLRIRREKTDQQGRGRWIGLPPGEHAETCPVRCLNDWLEVRGKQPGALFHNLHRRGYPPIGPDRVYVTVKQCLERIGIDPRHFGGHSLRSGAITAAAENGVSEMVIAETTGHRDMATLRRYFRRTNLWRANASGMLGL